MRDRYCVKKVLEDHTTWECCLRKSRHCKATCLTRNGAVIRENDVHNHSPSTALNEDEKQEEDNVHEEGKEEEEDRVENGEEEVDGSEEKLQNQGENIEEGKGEEDSEDVICWLEEGSEDEDIGEIENKDAENIEYWMEEGLGEEKEDELEDMSEEVQDGGIDDSSDPDFVLEDEVEEQAEDEYMDFADVSEDDDSQAPKHAKGKKMKKVEKATKRGKKIVHDKKVTCGECGRVFNNKSAKSQHVESHRGRIPCPKCAGTFLSKNSLRQHQTRYGHFTDN